MNTALCLSPVRSLVFPTPIDCTLSFEAMVRSGAYNWVRREVTVAHFPISSRGAFTLPLHLLQFSCAFWMDVEEILKRIRQLELVPGRIEHLLAFGARYPLLQSEYPIHALGSTWKDGQYGYTQRPCLDGYVRRKEGRIVGRRRDLDLRGLTTLWHESSFFLAYKES